MPRISQLVIALLIVLTFAKCAREYSNEGGGAIPTTIDTSGNSSALVKSAWEFKQGSLKYEGPVDTAFLSQEDNISILTIKGISKNGTENISITIRASIKIEKGKTYNTSREEAKFLYTASDTIYSAIPYLGGDIYVTITAFEDNKVMGTFKGLVLKKDGRSYEVTEGWFSSPLKRIPSTENKGYIMLWAEQSCNGPIEVKINNQPGMITKFPFVRPGCGDEGCVTYTSGPGIYDWVAYCGKDSVFGKAELKAGGCTKVLVSFPIRPATETTTEPAKLCKLNQITYKGELFPIMSNAINTSWSGVDAVALGYTVKLPGWILYLTYSIQREAQKILIIHPSGGLINEFITDARGRIVAYNGNTTPEILDAASPEYVTYEYDNNNNLTKRTYYKDTDRRPINETIFTWLNGNIIKITQTSLITGQSLDYHYEYFTDKPVKAMPFFYVEAQEILMYQSVLNFGNPVKNLPKKMKIYISPTNIYNYSFYGYVIDDNDYVQSMRLAIDGYNSGINFSFRYTCF